MVSVKQTFVKSYFCANLDLHFSTQMTISTNIKDYYLFSYFKIIMSSISVHFKGGSFADARVSHYLEFWKRIPTLLVFINQTKCFRSAYDAHKSCLMKLSLWKIRFIKRNKDIIQIVRECVEIS